MLRAIWRSWLVFSECSWIMYKVVCVREKVKEDSTYTVYCIPYTLWRLVRYPDSLSHAAVCLLIRTYSSDWSKADQLYLWLDMYIYLSSRVNSNYQYSWILLIDHTLVKYPMFLICFISDLVFILSCFQRYM